MSASQETLIRSPVSESEARQTFLLSLNDGLRPLLDAEEIQYQAAKALGEYLKTERVGYAEAQPDGETILVTRNFTAGVRGIEGVYRHSDFGPHDLPLFKAGRTVVRPDALADPALSPSDRTARTSIDARSSVTVPLLKDDKLVALLFVHQRAPREWSSGEVQLIEAVADRIWSAVVRARAENALRASEARLQVALDIAGLGTWEIDLLTGSGSIDERGAAIVGMNPGQITDVMSAQAMNVHPDDLKTLQDSVGAAVKRGGVFDLLYRVVHGEETRLVASRGRVLTDDAGRAVRIVGTNRDVTAESEAEERLRASEARYHAIVEQGPAALAVLEGPDHVFTLVSPNYEAWARHGSLVGRRFTDVAPEMRDSAFDRAHRRVFETGEPLDLVEERVLTDADNDGIPEEHFYTIHYTPLRDETGTIYGVATLAMDVTENVRARREAEEARATAEAANRAKGEFLAVMSHELRTPLNAIGGYAELIEMGIRGPVTEQQREDLRRVQQSQRHLLGLINQVLNYTRVSAGAIHYKIADVSVVEAIAAAEALIIPQINAHRLRYSLTPPADDIMVRADRDKLQQILLNLLSNAIKFTDAGGAITIACSQRDGRASVTVRDTGIGIGHEKLATIFEPFVQVHQGLTRPHEGVGLGLAISRDLAHGMGGDLVAESVPGEGSSFTLSLPIAAR